MAQFVGLQISTDELIARGIKLPSVSMSTLRRKLCSAEQTLRRTMHFAALLMRLSGCVKRFGEPVGLCKVTLVNIVREVREG